MAELRQQELTGPPAVVFCICGSPFTLSFVSLFCCSGLSSPCAFWLTHLRHTSDFRSRMLPFRDLIPASTVIVCSLVLYGAGKSWKEVPFFYKWLFWKFSWWVPVPSFSWSPQEPSVGSFRDLVNSQHLFRNQHSLNCIFLNLSCYKKKIVCYRFDG